MAKQLKSIADEIALSCLASRTRLLGRVITGIYDDALRAVGLTSPQMTILVALEHTGGVQPGALCDALKLDKSTLSRNVDRMESKGWLIKKPGADARSHSLELTEPGRRKLTDAIPHWRVAQQQAEETLGKGGMETLFRVSKRIRGF
ncbi:MAG: winged helix-turn-helix transcriptional regulator [Planctomycetes bacterium]|nr:winged helix-turn-helix transcriptional regulator [Planctomycetota bacterium]MCB9935398.1 winged helix-turn-helix transcriptional regulator [Planctomycetota bacterium]